MARIDGVTSVTAGISVALAVLLAAISLPEGASAQTAKNVICRGCVGSRDIGKNAVKTKHIKDSAVSSAKIKDGAVTPDKLAPTAQPAAANFSSSEGVDFPTLSTSDVVTASVTLNLPAPGVVILNSSGFAIFNDNPSGVVCAITKTTSTAGEPIVVGQNHNVTNARRMPIAATRGFVETAAGSQTYNYVCSAQGDASLSKVILTAVYVPQLSGPAPAASSAKASANAVAD